MRGDQRPNSVYLFCEAAVTNYHKLDDLTQQRFILLKFWRLEVQNLAGLPSLCGVLGGESIPCFFQLLLAFRGFLGLDHIPTVPTSILIPPSLLCISPNSLCPFSETLVSFRLPWIIQGKLKIFNLSAKTLFSR